MSKEPRAKSANGSISLNEAIGHLTQHTGRITALWTVFVAATFTAAGFSGLSDPQFGNAERLFLTAGYAAFSAGHWTLLRHCIAISNTISEDIKNALAGQASGPYHKSIRSIIANRSSKGYSLIAHAVIDACVVLIIWFRTIAGFFVSG